MECHHVRMLYGRRASLIRVWARVGLGLGLGLGLALGLGLGLGRVLEALPLRVLQHVAALRLG